MSLNTELSLLVLDFDGVLTDNRVLVFSDGQEAVFCSRADGQGINMIKQAGIKLIILSTETNSVVSARATKLGIPVIQGISDKATVLRNYCREQEIELHAVAYIGNDINDLSAMKIVGRRYCPEDAHKSIIEIASVVIPVKGGYGVVRYIANLLIKAPANEGLD